MIFVVALLAAAIAFGQTSKETPDSLIRFLAGDPEKVTGHDIGVVSCGIPPPSKEEAVTRALVRLAPASLPAIERALESIERDGLRSEFTRASNWLLMAYGKILGSQALPRLRRFEANGRRSMDGSFAVAMGLTSYVSEVRGIPGRLVMDDGSIFPCGGGTPEPSDFLDRFIALWLFDHRGAFEQNLGPRAASAFASLIDGRSWSDLRAVYRPGVRAVGYRVESKGSWPGPWERLDEARPASERPVDPEFDVEFVDAAGVGCGRHRVRFSGMGFAYKIDNADLSELLSVVSNCSAR